MKPKITVIIPVYGVEQYIEHCARSLFEQTLDDIEYLFIDDCSPDCSIDVLKEILREYPNRQGQVTIHRMECNSGQAKVREWGTKNATGDYIIHCDSDDWVDVNMYQVMYEKAIEDDADMVVCDYYTDKDGHIDVVNVSKPSSIHEGISELFLGRFPSYMWNKMVKREIYQSQDIEWPIGNMWEDMATMVQVVQKVKKIVYVSAPYYYYAIRTNSIVGKIDKASVLKKWNDVKRNVELILNHVDEKEFSDDVVTLKKRARNHLNPALSDDEVWRIYISAYPNLDREIFVSSRYTFREKVKSLLYRSKHLHRLAFSLFSVYAE